MGKCLPLFFALSVLAPYSTAARGSDVIVTIGDQVDPASPIVIPLAPDTLTPIPIHIKAAGAGPGPNIFIASVTVALWISDPAEVDPCNPNAADYPNIQLDLESGLFYGYGNGQSDPAPDGNAPMYERRWILSPEDEGRAPDGILAIVTIDTTGITSGQFIMALDWPSEPTDFSGPGPEYLPVTAEMGRVTLLVEEPWKRADFNGDGEVDGFDFIIMSENFGMSGMTREQGDTNWDGVIDHLDYINVKEYTGPSDSNPPLPEPLSLGLWSTCGLALLMRKKKVQVDCNSSPVCSGKAG
ncbi:MAG TPA: hypothetical protein VM695_00005 [Phycisphaerae bacterium]|nr:hypothetical protein [Phycisphaerae bacterium]